MATNKKPSPPVDAIPKDSTPLSRAARDRRSIPQGEGVDVDDTQIEEPKDDAFRKASPNGSAKARRRTSLMNSSATFLCPANTLKPFRLGWLYVTY